jgi:hypothetical protein
MHRPSLFRFIDTDYIPPSFLLRNLTHGYVLWNHLSHLPVREIYRTFNWLFPSFDNHRSWFYLRDPQFAIPPNWFSDTLYGTAEIQRHLFAHQNPSNCTGQKFFTISSLGGWSGIGSELHQAARWFAIGIKQNRIILWNHAELRQWTKGAECQGERTYDCFFLPLSNCSISRDSDVLDSNDFPTTKASLPDWHLEIVKHSPIDPRAYSWHWMAQVLGYVFRLNDWAMSEIRKYAATAGIDEKQLRSRAFDISVHIRHGDKGSEMVLIDDEEYVKAVKMIQSMLNRRVSVFLLTDDVRSLRKFKFVWGIDLYYLKYPYRIFNAHEKLRAFGAKAAIYALADVWIACHANWHIGTWMSHIDRMILELKAVSFGMASVPVLELEQNCVSAAHCHALNYTFNYRTNEMFKNEL